MILRVSARLATKIHVTPARAVPLAADPLADWSAHAFIADRTQYILVTNTITLYSVILIGRGIVDGDRLLDRTLAAAREILRADHFAPSYERRLIRSAAQLSFATAHSRSVTGSMVDFVHQARWHLSEEQLSPLATARRLNEAPMSCLRYQSPHRVLASIHSGLEEA